MQLLYNFTLISEKEFNLGPNNRGFQYNDGFFDTLIIRKKKIQFLTDHLDRMRRAMQALGLKALPQLLAADVLEKAILNLASQNNITAETIRIKINIWRKSGGLFTPETDEAEILITVQPQNAYPAIIQKAGFYHDIPNRLTPLSFFKGPYALHYVQAGIAKKKAFLDEIILLDEKGNVSESSVANIFWVKDNQLFTPTLETGCIAGIMRLNILRIAQQLNMPVQEGFFKPTDLNSAEVIFTSNVTGLRFLQEINGRPYATGHPLITAIQDLLPH